VNDYLKTFGNRETLVQFVKVGLVGGVNTVVTVITYWLWLDVVGLAWPVALFIAFTIATLLSYVLNRRWSFQLTDGGESLHETRRFFAINGLAYVATTALMALAKWWFGPFVGVWEYVALLIVSGIILLPKFAGYRDGVFGHALREDAAQRTPVA
jgi:putative flippase GtrA